MSMATGRPMPSSRPSGGRPGAPRRGPRPVWCNHLTADRDQRVAQARARPRRPPGTEDHGHQRSAGHDQRGDRLPLAGPHPLLVVRAGRARSDRHRSRRGRLPLHARGQADPGLQQPADVRQHRPRQPAGDRGDHRAGDEAPVRAAGVRHRDPRPSRREAGRDPPGRHEQGVLHPRRRRGRGERDQARPPRHRQAQAAGPLPRLPRRHGRRDDPDRRLPPLGERARHRRRRPLPGHPSLGREGAASGRRGAQRPRGRHQVRGRPDHRGDLPRDRRGHQRHPHPARRVPAGASGSCATSTGS